jgi:hypothetical protein
MRIQLLDAHKSGVGTIDIEPLSGAPGATLATVQLPSGSHVTVSRETLERTGGHEIDMTFREGDEAWNVHNFVDDQGTTQSQTYTASRTGQADEQLTVAAGGQRLLTSEAITKWMNERKQVAGLLANPAFATYLFVSADHEVETLLTHAHGNEPSEVPATPGMAVRGVHKGVLCSHVLGVVTGVGAGAACVGCIVFLASSAGPQVAITGWFALATCFTCVAGATFGLGDLAMCIYQNQIKKDLHTCSKICPPQSTPTVSEDEHDCLCPFSGATKR